MFLLGEGHPLPPAGMDDLSHTSPPSPTAGQQRQWKYLGAFWVQHSQEQSRAACTGLCQPTGTQTTQNQRWFLLIELLCPMKPLLPVFTLTPVSA